MDGQELFTWNLRTLAVRLGYIDEVKTCFIANFSIWNLGYSYYATLFKVVFSKWSFIKIIISKCSSKGYKKK